MDFKTYLKERREDLGYSQNKLAKALGITQPYYNSIERGEVKNPPSTEILERMIDIFELSKRDAEYFRYLAAIERTPKIILDKMKELRDQGPSSIPLYPRISAGIGVFAEDEVEDYISIPGLRNVEEVFSVRVKGDSMEPTIKNKGIIVCRHNSKVYHGEIGAFLVNGEAYVKRLQEKQGYVVLMSDNPNYQPIYVSPEDEFVSLGKVLKVINDIA